MCCANADAHRQRVHGLDGLPELHGGCDEDGFGGRELLPPGAEIVHLFGRHRNKESSQDCRSATSHEGGRRRLVAFSEINHLVAQELVQVSQLVGVGDFPIQRGVPLLRHPRGTADLDGAVTADAFASALRLRLRGRPGGGSWKTGSILNR